jgi:site-specific DNA-cytosine methylase
MIDLFAGAGGLSEGLSRAGFCALYANELVCTYAETYRQNHPDTAVESRDLREVDAAVVRKALGLRRGDLDLIAGGHPMPYRTVPSNDYQRTLRAGSDAVYNHEAARLSKVNMERFAHIPPGVNWTDIPFELLPKGMKAARRSDHTKRYGRVDPDGLASTILTKCDPHWGAYVHYEQDRAFTVREAARLQSFPDTYHFSGSRVEQYE